MLALLTGSEAGPMLRTALADYGQVRSWSVHAVHHRPGAGVSVGYAVVVDVMAAGGITRTDSYVVATTGRINEARLAGLGGVTLSYGEIRVHVWRHPDDPELPALRLACDPNELSEYFGEYADVELLAYRPTRRAVVRVDLAEVSYFAKICRPTALNALETRFRMLERAGFPAPRLKRVDDRGLLVTSEIEGLPLNRVYAQFRDGQQRAMRRTLTSLREALDSLPMVALGLAPRPAWVDRHRHYASAATAAIPERRADIDQLCADIAELCELGDFGPTVPTHGDFYEANVFIDPQTGYVSGVLDVDGVGPGHRVNDWACLLGHLSVLPSLSPKAYGQTPALLSDWRSAISAHVDPVALAASAAGVVLSLVSGARRSKKKDWRQEAYARLDVARAWIAWGREYLDDVVPASAVRL